MSDTTEDMEHYDPSEWADRQAAAQAAGHEPQANEPMPVIQVRDRPLPVSTAVDKPITTPEQAKVDAVAGLTMTAYARASELKLTPEEQEKLQKEFPDEAFRPGAAGKENLLYIEHAFLRDRLNEVLGLGQWSIIPRKRWAEDFEIPPKNRGDAPVQASRVYVEAMLVVRGCFVAEAIGDMVYYKNNQSQNYGDAVEGAKTAALRRCTKELGIGLQAWKKDWCQGWWQRNPNGRTSHGHQGASGNRQPQSPSQSRTAAPAPQSAPKPAAKTADLVPPPAAEATQDQRTRFIAMFPGTAADYATVYFVDKGWLKKGETLAQLPLKHVPTTRKVAEDLVAQVDAFASRPPAGQEEAWRSFKMPWGKNKDTPLAELEKNYLFGLVMNYEVEREYKGQPKREEAIAKDEEFRRMLDDAGRHYDWIKQRDPSDDRPE